MWVSTLIARKSVSYPNGALYDDNSKASTQVGTVLVRKYKARLEVTVSDKLIVMITAMQSL
jgi:hypothetical protein